MFSTLYDVMRQLFVREKRKIMKKCTLDLKLFNNVQFHNSMRNNLNEYVTDKIV